MDPTPIESRVDALTRHVQLLTERVDQLSARLGESPISFEDHHLSSAEASEKMLSWAESSALLPRISTVCFLMVVALILRTITDRGIIGIPVGSVIGIAYAGSLLLIGAYGYFKSHALSPIFTTCGAVLMFSIVVETHSHFEWLPVAAAYALLAIVCVGGTGLSVRYGIKAPGIVAIVGACLASVALELPEPTFPYLMAMLGLFSLAAYLIAPIPGCAWVRWIVLAVTIVMMAVWLQKLLSSLAGAKTVSLFVQGWFPFVVILFSIMNLGIALLGMVRSRKETISVYNRVLPTLNVVWAYAMLSWASPLLAGSEVMFAVAGVVAGIGHLMVSLVLGNGKLRTRQASSALYFAGSLLLVLWLPRVISGLWTLPILSAVALAAALLSVRRENFGLLINAYVIQTYSTLMLAFYLVTMPMPLEWALSALVLTGVSLWQFGLRQKGDVIFLLAALGSAFLMLRVLAYHVLQAMVADFADEFVCAQSVIINAAAVGLMLISVWRRDKELRNVAIGVMVVGGVKSMIVDLLSVHGVPLVVSIFTFGLALAFDSIMLRRWQHPETQT